MLTWHVPYYGPFVPGPVKRMRTFDDALTALARRLLEEALVAARGHRASAAAVLGMSTRRLDRLAASYLGPDRLRSLAATHGWPGTVEQTAAARAARWRCGQRRKVARGG